MDLSALAVAFLAAVAAGGIAYVFIYPFLSGEVRAERRQKALAGSPLERRNDRTISAASRREQVAQSLKDLENREKTRHKVTLEQRIAQAGLAWSKTRFFVTSAAIGLLVGFLVLSLTLNLYIAGAGLFAGGAGLPLWLLAFLKKRRINKFLEELPNAIDVIVRGVRAGLPLGDCLRIVANEVQEPVRSEFRYIVESQTLGIPVGDSVAKLYDRIPVPEVNFFSIVIAIQQKAGGSLSEALGNLSRVLRDRKKMKAKIASMSQEAKASAAIIAALPFVVAILTYLSSPTYIELLWTTEAGMVALGGSAVWMIVGVLVMKKNDQLRLLKRRQNCPMMQLLYAKFTDPQFLATILAAIAAAATVLTLAMPLLDGDNLNRRMKAVALERERIRARERERLAKGQKASLRLQPKAYMKQVVERFNLGEWLGTETARKQLTMAGYRGAQAEIGFLFFRLVVPIGCLLVALFYLFVLEVWDTTVLIRLGVAICCAFFGLKMPEIFLSNAIKKRQLSIRRAWPDALDLLLICVESGMSIEAAFRRVSTEIGMQSIALAEELTLTTAELSYLPERRVAYENLGTRTGLEPVKSITTALIQAERYGTPLGQALRVLSQESRDQRMSEAEKKAAGLPPKLTVPMILFFLPVLFVVIMSPALIQVFGWK